MNPWLDGGVQLTCSKAKALLAGGITLDPPGAQHEGMVATLLEVVTPGMRIVGVSVETKAVQRQSVPEARRGDPAELLRAIVPMGGARPAFQSCARLRSPA